MPLEAGARLGPYEVLVKLGEGGMGEVYQAIDTRLNRAVAIKVMPPHLAIDPDMRERFDREAQTIAGLTHPNICVLHDVGHHRADDAPAASDEIAYIVMEFLEGETLAERLERVQDPSSASRQRTAGVGTPTPRGSGSAPAQTGPGSGSGNKSFSSRSSAKLLSRPFTVEESLAIAIQIADALDTAHGQGIIHRDLKPANIMLLATGGVPHVKLLDFGLAKWKPATESLASAMTIAADLTVKGAMIGTMRYMAPEQLEGGEADARTDIFAFGTVLYEVLTGKKAFDGKNPPSLAGAIMTAEPAPISRLQPLAPPALERVVKRCLAKDPDDRWQTAHDLLIQLRWIAERGTQEASSATGAGVRQAPWPVKAALAAGLVLITVAGWPAYSYFRGSSAAGPFAYRIPVRGLEPSFSISPDGRTLALVARPNSQDAASLYLRSVKAITFRRVAGTDGASQPFWSPDGNFVGVIVNGRLKKVPVSGGSPQDLGEADGFTGGTWSRDNTILFGSKEGLYRISGEGGKRERVTTVAAPETGHFWPSFLPDGNGYLFLAWSGDASKREVVVGSLGSSERTPLMRGATNAMYAAPGYVVFHRDATIFAQRFSEGARSLEGDPVQIAGEAVFDPQNGRGAFDVSQNGSLVYFESGGGSLSRGGIVNNAVYGWRDRMGSILEQVGEQGPYGDIDLSPDGRRVALTRGDAGGTDIWITDWQRNVSHRLTLDPADDLNPVWHPSGTKVAFTSYRNGNADVFVMNADGRGDAVPLLNSPSDEQVEDWSKDGRYVAYKLGQNGYDDLYVLPIDAAGKPGTPIAVVQGKYRKDEPQFSYDGKWLAYTSDESGTFQIYVISFPELTQKHQVTPPEGGGQPRWRRDGKELFYRAFDNRVMAVNITLGPAIASDIPRELFVGFNTPSARDPVRHQWSVTPDGQRFVIRLANGSGTGRGGLGGLPVAPPTFTASQGAGPAQSSSLIVERLITVLGWPSAFRRGAK